VHDDVKALSTGNLQLTNTFLHRSPMPKSFRELSVWNKAIDLTTLIYESTIDFPKQEIYGRTSQMRRAAVPSRATSPKVPLVARGEIFVSSSS
jgi:hypothetical protein